MCKLHDQVGSSAMLRSLRLIPSGIVILMQDFKQSRDHSDVHFFNDHSGRCREYTRGGIGGDTCR